MNDIYHYGVKGMKWGVRKERPKSSGKKKTAAKQPQKKKTSAKDVVKFGAKFTVWALGTYLAVTTVNKVGKKVAMSSIKNGSDFVRDTFEDAKILKKDGTPMTAAEIQRLKDLGFL